MKPALNTVLIHVTKRKSGSLRIQQDFQYCPTRTEQHSAQETDINYLMEKYKPDELAQYLAARNAYKQEIVGHDFSQEPDLQSAMTLTYRLKQAYERLPESITREFNSHSHFLKFIDNPDNQDKMVALGLLTPKQIAEVSSNPPPSASSSDPSSVEKPGKTTN